MRPETSIPPALHERPLFTWLVRIGILANLLVAVVLTAFYIYSYFHSTW